MRKVVTATKELLNSIKTTIYILDNTEGVEIATPYWVSATEVLENKTKSKLWLQTPKPARYRGSKISSQGELI